MIKAIYNDINKLEEILYYSFINIHISNSIDLIANKIRNREKRIKNILTSYQFNVALIYNYVLLYKEDRRCIYCLNKKTFKIKELQLEIQPVLRFIDIENISMIIEKEKQLKHKHLIKISWVLFQRVKKNRFF